MAALALAAALWLQEDASRLIERLGAEAVEERDEAIRQLKKRGEGARGALEKAASSGDAEVAERARHLLRILEARRSLTPAVLAAFPGADERLALGGAPAWTALFLEAAGPPHGLKKEDLEPFLPRAYQGARDPRDRARLCALMPPHGLRSAIPSLVLLLRDEDENVRSEAGQALAGLSATEAVPDLVALLGTGETSGTRVASLRTLCSLRAREALPHLAKLHRDADVEVRLQLSRSLAGLGEGAVPTLLPLLADPVPGVRIGAIDSLADLRAPRAIPAITKLLKDPSPEVGYVALYALLSLEAREAVPEIVRLLDSPQAFFRAHAARVLGSLGTRETASYLTPLLKDQERVRTAAAESLCRLGAKEGAPALLELAADADVPLHVLNALRRRGDWERLASKKLKLSAGDPWEKLAREAGLPLDASAVSRTEEVMWTIAKMMAAKRERPASVIDALEELQTLNQAEYVLEADRIRVLPRPQALEFWKAWWAKERGK